MNLGQIVELLNGRPKATCDIGYFQLDQATKIVTHRKVSPAISDITAIANQVAVHSPSGMIFIDIYRPNGSSFKKEESYTLSNQDLIMPTPKQQTFGFSGLPQQAPALTPPGMDMLGQFKRLAEQRRKNNGPPGKFSDYQNRPLRNGNRKQAVKGGKV